MFFWLLVLGTGVVAWRMASFEERRAWPFGLGAAAATWFVAGWFGNWWALSPLAVLAGVFALLWALRSRDSDQGRIVR